jgi:hypothetical protein
MKKEKDIDDNAVNPDSMVDDKKITVAKKAVDVNPGYVRLQNLQPVEQTIPLLDGGAPLCLTPAKGRGAISRPVLLKNLPTAFVERLIKEKKIKRVV